MDPRELLKPLPLLLVVLFALVGVADLVQNLTEDPPPPATADPVVARFYPEEPIIDLRATGVPASVEILPTPNFEPGGWSASNPRGVWTKGKESALTLDLGAGGHRNMVLECMPGGGKRPVRSVRVLVNQVDCGEIILRQGWGSYSIPVPDAVLRSGRNRFVFRFKDRADARKIRRALLIRRLALLFDPHSSDERIEHSRPISFDREGEKISFGVAGTLEIPLRLDDRTDALRLRYRFSSVLGRADVAVMQLREGEVGARDAVAASMSAEKELSGRLRVPLHGRRGAYVLRIRAMPGEPHSRFLIWSLRLTEEGDPTGRRWSVNPLRS